MMRLGLPLERVREAWCASFALGLYLATTCNFDLAFYDSAELALVAAQFGVGHPIGQPLHTIVAGLLARATPWAPLVGVSLASIVPAALAVIPLTSLAESLLGETSRSRIDRVALPAAIAVVGVHPALWDAATRVESYALATFVGAYACAWLAAIEPSRHDLLRRVFGVGLALGVLGCANAYMAAWLGLAMAPRVLTLARSSDRAVPVVGSAIGGGLLGLGGYVYVVLAAQRDDVFVWGAPRDLESWWAYFRGADYAHNRGATWPERVDHLAWWATDAAANGSLLLLGIGAIAMMTTRARARLGAPFFPVFLAAYLFLLTSHAVFDPTISDYANYAGLALSLAAAASAARLTRWLLESRRANAALLFTALIVATLIAPPSFLERTRATDRTARVLASSLLRSMPQNAIVVAASDHWAAPLLYLQEVEHARRDVVVVVRGLASSEWHWDRIAETHTTWARFALRGPGGAPARLRRMLVANGARPVFVESVELAEELGLRPCGVRWFVEAATSCERRLDPEPATRATRELTNTVRSGSPPSHEVLAAVGMTRGLALQALGAHRAAFDAFLSGAGDDASAFAETCVNATGRLAIAAPATWRRAAPIGDPARNLFLAARLASECGDVRASATLLEKALELDLPEAWTVAESLLRP